MTTMLANLINPEVMAPVLRKKIVDAIKFAPLAQMGHDLQGTPGNTLSIPTFKYIGHAEDLGEGVTGTVAKLEATSSQVTVKKAVKNVEITDEALLSGYGDPMGEIENQLAVSMGQKVDEDVIEALKGLGKERTAEVAALNLDGIADALVLFGEDLDEEMFIFVSPRQYAELRKDKDFVHIQNGIVKVTGHVGQIFGVNVVVSNKVKDENFIVKGGAIGIELKREVTIETDRNVLNKTNVVSIDRHYIAYLRDESRAIKVKVATP